MTIYTVCFFGHRFIEEELQTSEKIYDLVCSIIKEKEYTDFLVGRDGGFDQIVSSAVKRAKRIVFDANSSLVWVMAYPKKDYLNNTDDYERYYDSIEICDESNKAYPKAAITLRNRKIIDRSDLCVFCVNHNYGGAWNAMKYAINKNKEIVNIGHFEVIDNRKHL